MNAKRVFTTAVALLGAGLITAAGALAGHRRPATEHHREDPAGIRAHGQDRLHRQGRDAVGDVPERALPRHQPAVSHPQRPLHGDPSRRAHPAVPLRRISRPASPRPWQRDRAQGSLRPAGGLRLLRRCHRDGPDGILPALECEHSANPGCRLHIRRGSSQCGTRDSRAAGIHRSRQRCGQAQSGASEHGLPRRLLGQPRVPGQLRRAYMARAPHRGIPTIRWPPESRAGWRCRDDRAQQRTRARAKEHTQERSRWSQGPTRA